MISPLEFIESFAMIKIRQWIAAAFLVALGAGLGASVDPSANAQVVPNPSGTDVLLTFPLLEQRGWFVHAYNGRVRACSVDGASVGQERTAPRCSHWSE